MNRPCLSLYALKFPALSIFLLAATPPLASQALLPIENHKLVTPLTLVEGFQDAQIAIANRAPSAVAATLVFRDDKGAELASEQVSLVANGLETITFSSVLKDTSISAVRSVSLQYQGEFRTLASQVTLIRYKSGASIDATLYEDREFSSSQLNAVWWQPAASRVYVAVTNTGDSPETAMVTVNEGLPRAVLLPPHGTQLEDLTSTDLVPTMRSLHLQSSSPSGALRATGFVATPNGYYVNTLRFVDPALSLSSSLYATGLTFSGPNYSLAVKNLTNQTITLTGRAFLSNAQGTSPRPKNLMPFTILPGEIASIRLEESVGTSLGSVAALELRSSGPPGSIVASLSILYPNAPTLSASVPFRDVSTEEQATGGYPWRLDGDYTTHAFLTNASNEERAVVIQIFIPARPPYVLGRVVLAPGETQVFNVRDLRDAKTPDVMGRTLPADATSGQFVWAVDVSQTKGGGLLGRTVMESKADATLRSYSCFSCTCGYAIAQIGISPSNFNLAVGDSSTVNVTGYYQSPCGTTQVPPPTTVYPQWRSYDGSVISLSGNQVAGVGPGQSSFTASYYSNVITINQGCSSTFEELTAQGSALIVPQGCPTGMQITQIVTHDLPEVDRPDIQALTGIGILTLMTLTPSSQDFSGSTIQEDVTPIAGSNTCPSSIQQYTDFPTIALGGSAPFTPGTATAHWEGADYGAVPNSFYDSHRLLLNFDVLGAAGVNQCQAQAGQVYYCQGKPVASFILTNVYTHGTLNGVPVTNVMTTKQ